MGKGSRADQCGDCPLAGQLPQVHLVPTAGHHLLQNLQTCNQALVSAMAMGTQAWLRLLMLVLVKSYNKTLATLNYL